MKATEHPKLTVLFGAGASIGAGLPSTNQITEHLLSLDVHNQHFYRELFDLLIRCGYKEPNFELLLHALETIEPLSIDYNIGPFDVSDYSRPVLQCFTEIIPATNMLFRNGSGSSWRGLGYFQIAALIQESLEKSESKEVHLQKFLNELAEQFTLKVFTLNYDDLVDRVKLHAAGDMELANCDGFVANRSNYYSTFDPVTFLRQSQGFDPLLVHLHGSINFGYEQGSYVDLHKYRTAKVAIQHLQDEGFTQKVHGRLVTGGPIISGLSKLDQLLYRPRPYGYYFKSFIDNVLETPRLLILGYGGLDRHFNEWIIQCASVHQSDARIAYLGQGSLNGLAEHLLLILKQKNDLKNVPYQGHSLIIDPTHFPYENSDTVNGIIKFLDSTAKTPK